MGGHNKEQTSNNHSKNIWNLSSPYSPVWCLRCTTTGLSHSQTVSRCRALHSLLSSSRKKLLGWEDMVISFLSPSPAEWQGSPPAPVAPRLGWSRRHIPVGHRHAVWRHFSRSSLCWFARRRHRPWAVELPHWHPLLGNRWDPLYLLAPHCCTHTPVRPTRGALTTPMSPQLPLERDTSLSVAHSSLAATGCVHYEHNPATQSWYVLCTISDCLPTDWSRGFYRRYFVIPKRTGVRERS